MLTMLLRFPGGRYHATPWGHHVNEGLVEWPPSPWRLLRALISTGYTALGWNGTSANGNSSRPPLVAQVLLEKLASVAPRYRLPPATGAHTRHYMPIGVMDKGREKTTLVFDTWAQVDAGALCVTWDVSLDEAEEAQCRNLVEHLGYLGRSESWVEGRLLSSEESMPHGTYCMPCIDNVLPGPGWEQISMLGTTTPAEYANWRQSAVGASFGETPPVNELPKKATKEQKDTAKAQKAAFAKYQKRMAQLDDLYPADLIECLQARTSELQTRGWSQPPGTRRMLYWRRSDALEAGASADPAMDAADTDAYWRRSDALEAGAPKLRRIAARVPHVKAMLLSMATQSGNDHALPSVIRTLPQAELLHQTLIGIASKLQGGVPSALSGCDSNRRPLRGSHSHAHILPLDLDGDDHLDHVLIWAPMGLDAAAQTAIRAARQTFTKGGILPIRLATVAAGPIEQLYSLPGVWGNGIRSVLGSRTGNRTWQSMTPFVAPRHLKRQGRNTLEGQIAAELISRTRCPATEIQVLDPRQDNPSLRLRHFVRHRRKGAGPPVDMGFAIRLIFDEPQRGPISLGYGSHYGLGLFSAC